MEADLKRTVFESCTLEQMALAYCMGDRVQVQVEGEPLHTIYQRTSPPMMPVYWRKFHRDPGDACFKREVTHTWVPTNANGALDEALLVLPFLTSLDGEAAYMVRPNEWDKRAWLLAGMQYQAGTRRFWIKKP